MKKKGKGGRKGRNSPKDERKIYRRRKQRKGGKVEDEAEAVNIETRV